MRVEIAASQGISRLSKHLLEYVPIDVKLTPDIETADAIVLLDTNTIQQLGELAEKIKSTRAPVIVIDHHASHPETAQLAAINITNEQVSSTCEIVYGFYKETNTKAGLDEAKALFLEIGRAHV